MDAYDARQSIRFKSTLERRVAELRAVLGESESLRDTAQDAPREVVDTKDMASDQSIAALQDVQAEHAAAELSLALAALRRLEAGTYGQCLDCGEAIDLRRLVALPATPCCTRCQGLHEHPRPPAGRL